MAVREAEPVGSLQEVKDAGLDREDLLGIYRNMLITRGIEERGHILYKQGKIPGSFYTGRGNEASAVGVATAMGPDDVGTPLQRDMGVHVTRGVEPWRIFAQYMGRADGPTHGRDGNVHIGDAKLGLHAMVSHLPAMLPVAVGMALAFRIREEKRVAIAWCGEGAAARGDAHEGMNLAGVRRLPVVFVIDNNQWAYSTPTYLEYAVEHLADRAHGYGFDGRRRRRHRRARRLPRGEAGDREGARGRRPDADRVASRCAWRDTPSTTTPSTSRARCSRSGRGATRSSGSAPGCATTPSLTDEEEDEITAGVKRLLNESLERAEESPLPDPATLLDGVFAEPEELDTPHHK